MESLNKAPESGATSSFASSDLSRFGRIASVELVIDLDAMFDKSNYGAFLAQSAASEMGDWTGVPLTVDEPIGEFAAIVTIDGSEYAINLAFCGKFNSMWGKSDLLLMVTDEDDKQLLCPGVNEDHKLFFLVCTADPEKSNDSLITPFMAVMEPWYKFATAIATPNIAYTLLLNAYLNTTF